MRLLQSHASPTATLELHAVENGHVLCIREAGGRDAAAPISADTLRALLAAVDPKPAIVTPDSLGVAASAIAAELVHVFTALAELAKTRPAETDYLLRYFVKHVEAWRPWAAREAA